MRGDHCGCVRGRLRRRAHNAAIAGELRLPMSTPKRAYTSLGGWATCSLAELQRSSPGSLRANGRSCTHRTPRDRRSSAHSSSSELFALC